MKSILISIHPEWCEKIFRGVKTVEVRKTAPKIEPPFKVYVYQTKHRGRNIIAEVLNAVYGGGKVIGEFICDRVTKYDPATIACVKWETNGGEVKEHLRYNAGACLTAEEMFDYSKGKPLRGWHITSPKLYDKPRELSEFKRPLDVVGKILAYDEDVGHVALVCDGCDYATWNDKRLVNCKNKKCLQRKISAPQSWCYVEEVEE